MLTLPLAKARGFSGYACGAPLRSRLKAVSPPTARGALSEERAPLADEYSHSTQKKRKALSPWLKPGAAR
jgi:hypothetical protein